MKLTTRGRYAVTAMVDLVRHGDDAPTSLADISQRQDISLSYLEQLFAKLRRHGLVRSIRGPGGGYMLLGSPGEISIASIIRAVDEPIEATSCGKKDGVGCRRDSRCLTHDLWVQLGEHITGYLESVDLGCLSRGAIPPIHGKGLVKLSVTESQEQERSAVSHSDNSHA
ncbi:MAG: Rrf2 family transcriptional regulator [Magnetococcales bacterium]|nr:Rrf2 family transcriptional regulator [Magnetococcales bacterium]